jgi:ABC-2 type transport system ATP-binding protein
MTTDSPILEVSHLRKRFKDGVEALKGVSLSLSGGSFLGLVGPDGAGKTTLLRIIAGLLSPTDGSVQVNRLDPARDGAAIRKILGYMPQKFGLYEDLSVIENLTLNARLRQINGQERQDAFDKLLDFTDLREFQSRRAGALSGGMKQKLGLACALLAKPKLLLLDEPSVGVDPISRRELWKMVQGLVAEGMAVIWSTAYLDEAENCRNVLLLNEGEILFSGQPGDLTQKVGDRAFKILGMKTGRRKLLARLLDHESVSDGVIEGDNIRLILREGHGLESVQEMLPDEARPEGIQPRFEDAFIDLLGGGPGGSSVLAGQVPQRETQSSEEVVEAQNLSKRYGDFYATRDVNFSIHPGEIFGLLGPNGAGKSTTFKMMCGLARPTAGKALVKGLSLQQAGGRARRRIGYMAQKFSLYGNLTVRQNLEFFSGAYGLKGRERRDRIDLMIEIFSLERFLKVSPDTLPLGYKQRLALACAVMHDPDILFLDEPTSGVDPVTRREFWTHIYGLTAKGITIMVTTHFMEEAEYCDRIGLIHRGELIAIGSPDELKASVQSDKLPHPTMEDTFVELVQTQSHQPEVA